MDEFLKAYLEAALWTASEELDALNKCYWDFEDASVASARQECEAFKEECAFDLALVYHAGNNYGPAQAGHDFWLTRNGHGAGFWDRGLGDAGDRLSEVAQRAGERYVWLDTWGKVYCSA